uniref:C2H2-type domain-containing protein n=1 Tax=Gasterosteus aculeatus aculeatus TaxID=481459 RepID=A0AAQ4S3Q8_GASAC
MSPLLPPLHKTPPPPGAPRKLDSQEDEGPEITWSTATEAHAGDHESTRTEEPNAPQLGPADLADSDAWNVSELFLSRGKLKDCCPMEEEEEEGEGEKRPRGNETEELERDVYTFPGDSDAESPPPAPWAHCTFIQRCQKKRVLFRPFSGHGASERTSPEAGGSVDASPQKFQTAEAAQLDRAAGGCTFEEFGLGKTAVEEPAKLGGKGDDEEVEEEPGEEIFTCVECSIYFKKQVHLQEHIVEHCQSSAAGGRRSGKACGFRCVECGWNLPNRLVLADHHRRHQESRRKILKEIEKLNEDGKMVKPTCSGDTDRVTSQQLSPAPVLTPDQAVRHSVAFPLKSLRSPAPGRTASAGRRRFVCTKCNFSTRTSQALANHTKTHNRKKTGRQMNPTTPGPPSCLPSTSLACGHCAFLTSSQSVMKEHQKLVHPMQFPISGALTEETGKRSRSTAGSPISKPALTSDRLCGSGSLRDATRGEGQQGATASHAGATPDSAAALPASRVVFKGVEHPRFRRRGKTLTNLDNFLEDGELTRSQEEEKSPELDTERFQPDFTSPVGVKRPTRAQSSTEDCSAQQSASLSPPTEQCGKDELEVDKEGKVFFLRNRVTAAPVDTDSEDNNDGAGVDEEPVRHLLSEGFLDEDLDETDEDSEAFKSVERKCPYCPDRFHNGIGLANHVRGHLNRVGVSYNVRHFISPEEVNAIEKKYSYQKKKKKVANFDPETFSVMHCEFCSAGFDTRAGLSSHARAHLRDFGITNWDVTISPIHILRELFSSRPDLEIPTAPPRSTGSSDEDQEEEEKGEGVVEVKLERDASEREQSAGVSDASPPASPQRSKEEDALEESAGEEEEAAEDDEEEPRACSAAGSELDAESRAVQRGLGRPPCRGRCRLQGLEVRRVRSPVRDPARAVQPRPLSPAAAGSRRLGEQRGADRPTLPNRQGAPRGRTDLPYGAPFRQDVPRPLRRMREVGDMDFDEDPIPFSILGKAAKALPPSSSAAPSPSPGASPGPPSLRIPACSREEGPHFLSAARVLPLALPGPQARGDERLDLQPLLQSHDQAPLGAAGE